VSTESEAQRNKAAARAEFEIWSTGQLERLGGLVAENVVHHDPYDPHAADGLVGLRKWIEANRTTFPDMRIEVEDQVAEGDRVATRWITIERFEDSKVVESWRSMDIARDAQADRSALSLDRRAALSSCISRKLPIVRLAALTSRGASGWRSP
jgi:predicted ester cyclase